MKRIYYFSLLAAGFIILACSKNIDDRSENFPALEPTNIDLNAGAWKTLLLATPTEVAVPAPTVVGTPAYAAELNEIKSWQKNLTAAQKEKIRFWSAGGVLRWNEIMRTLVARYNLPPYQNADGSYPIPSSANPFAYPLFPFANPPYAARAYAYVSAAQYDALVAAWHYKSVYNQAAPYKVDSSIQRLLPASNLPSYPSEDAVLAGVTVEMMKLLFPTELDYVQQMAMDQKLARIMAGANTRSEIEAGEALGKAIAQKFVARARTDRAGAAVGNQAVWAQFESETRAKGETPWISLDAPKRPPMLPLFGKTKSFLMDSMMVITNRPAPPPSVHSDQFKKELDEVLYYTQNATPERMRIVQFWADGVGTYTPPGHWNAIAAEALVGKQISEVRWARNMALLNLAMMDAAICCWDAKYYYFNPRPTQANPEIKTLTGVPNFPAYTSGHSTFSGAAATYLSYLVPEKANEFKAMATEASMSRLYGGIHYRSDCEAGMKSGTMIGENAIARAKADGADF